MSTLYCLIGISLCAAFIILFIEKIGMRDKIVLKAPAIISELFSCDFCLSFWVGVILAIILAIFTNDFSILFIPIFSTPITRFLIA